MSEKPLVLNDLIKNIGFHLKKVKKKFKRHVVDKVVAIRIIVSVYLYFSFVLYLF